MIIGLYSCGCHHGCREPLFRLAKPGLSQISGGRVLRVIGDFVLSLSRRCFRASVGDKFCRNTSAQRWPLHRPFDPFLALSVFWLRNEAKGLKRTLLPAPIAALFFNGAPRLRFASGFSLSSFSTTDLYSSLVRARCPQIRAFKNLYGFTSLPTSECHRSVVHT